MNLKDGVAIRLTNPSVAARDCSHCRKFCYDEKTGEQQFRDAAKTKPIERGKAPPPCELSIGCPKGHWSDPKTLSEKNWRAYIHYCECKAVGEFPSDPVVRQNAGIIRAVEDAAQRQRDDLVPVLMTIAAAKGRQGGR